MKVTILGSGNVVKAFNTTFAGLLNIVLQSSVAKPWMMAIKIAD